MDTLGPHEPNDYLRLATELFPRETLELYATAAREVQKLLIAREQEYQIVGESIPRNLDPFEATVVFQLLGISPRDVAHAAWQPSRQVTEARVLIPTDPDRGDPQSAIGPVLSFLGAEVTYLTENREGTLNTAPLMRITERQVSHLPITLADFVWKPDYRPFDLIYVDSLTVEPTEFDTYLEIPWEIVAMDRISRLLTALDPVTGKLIARYQPTSDATQALQYHLGDSQPAETGWRLTQLPTYQFPDALAPTEPTLDKPIHIVAPYQTS